VFHGTAQVNGNAVQRQYRFENSTFQYGTEHKKISEEEKNHFRLQISNMWYVCL
jgi:uncharacterized ferritin-like protein (DUF455 family)